MRFGKEKQERATQNKTSKRRESRKEKQKSAGIVENLGDKNEIGIKNRFLGIKKCFLGIKKAGEWLKTPA